MTPIVEGAPQGGMTFQITAEAWRRLTLQPWSPPELTLRGPAPDCPPGQLGVREGKEGKHTGPGGPSRDKAGKRGGHG